jgi:hypothetical protein
LNSNEIVDITSLAIAIVGGIATVMIYSDFQSRLIATSKMLDLELAQAKSLSLELNQTQRALGDQTNLINQFQSKQLTQGAQIVRLNRQNGNIMREAAALNQSLNALNISAVEYSSDPTHLQAGQQDIAHSRCSPGEIATGGGFDTSDASVIVLHSGVSSGQG